MDVTADLAAPTTPDVVYPWVEDLARYPAWLDIVARAEPTEPHPDDVGPAWLVDLRGRLGPMSRTKRLRMVRTEHVVDAAVTFERAEHDGRSHSPWVLRARVRPDGAATILTMDLHYGGNLWGSVLERLLGDEIERSRDRLLERLAAADT